jgi:tetratricopeptide (TPR) repeat protein
LKPLIRLTLITTLFSLTACTGLLKPKDGLSLESNIEQSNPSKDQSKPEYTDFDLEKDTLFDLLVAEVAAQRSQYSITLLNYIQQARMTRDPAIIRRAINASQLLKDFEAIEDLSLLWTEVEPDSIPAHQLLAFQYSLQKEYQQAVVHIDKIIELGGEARIDSLAVSSHPLPKNEKQVLLGLYHDLYEKYPDNHEVGYSYALIQRNLDLYDEALATLAPILSSKPEFEPPSILKANVLYDQGKLDEAIEYAAAKFDDFPKNHNLGRLYASMLIEKKELDKAESVFKSLMDLYPQAPSLKLSYALVMLENNKIEQASAQFHELITQGVHANEANFYLGRIADSQEQPEQAIEFYSKVGASSHFEASIERASFLLVRSGQTEEMVTRLTALRAVHPSKALKLWLLQVKLLSGIRDRERLMQSLDEAITLYPNDEQLLYARAMNRDVKLEFEDMEKDLRAIIKINPDNAIAINALGYTLADQTDRIEEAFALIQKAISLKPGNPAILDSMGWVLFRLNKKEDALVFLLKAFQQFQDGEIAAHLGEVLWELNQTSEAKEVWLNVLQKQPQHKVLLETINRIQPSLLLPPTEVPSNDTLAPDTQAADTQTADTEVSDENTDKPVETNDAEAETENTSPTQE